MPDAEATSAVKTVEVEGLGEVPARFGSQEALEEYAGALNNDQFKVFADLLRSRKWTKKELEERVQPIKPKVDILSTSGVSVED